MPDTTPSPEDVQVGEAVWALREARGLSQADLARAIGVSQQLISFIESGERRATLANCQAMAEALGVRLAAITGERLAQLIEKGNGTIAAASQPAQAS